MPTVTFQASCAQALPEGLSEWIHLLPAGEIITRDGRGPYKNTNPQGIVEEFLAYGMPIAIDYEHQSLDAEEKTAPTPAAGWIQELEIRGGEIWARVEWNERAAEMIAAKEYRYISPVFQFNPKTGVVGRIVSAGLTNRPNLYLQAVARQGGNMNELMERLCCMLNLPVTSTPEEVVTHLQRLIDLVGGNASAAQEIAKALSLPDGTELPAIATAVASRLSQETDPAKFVARAEHDRVASTLQQLQEQGKKEEASRKVSEAIASRKVSPAMKSWATDYATRDPEGFSAFVAAAPAIVAEGSIAPAGAPKGSVLDADTAAQKQNLIDQYKADHTGVSDKDALLAVAAANPELFRERR
ncbi:MAG: phage protease [bacterium]|nr:phage protease [bacterium]